MSVPAGWYNDPQNPQFVRWWDGAQWTQYTQPIQPNRPPEQPVDRTQSPRQKVGLFGAKKAAEGAIAEVDRLNAILAEKGLLELSAVQQETAEMRKAAAAERQALIAEEQRMREELNALRRELETANLDLIASRQSAVLQDFGVYDFEHPAENSAHLASILDRTRADYKDMARAKEAIHATSSFTFNNSSAQGNKFVKQMSTIMLRAYNAEAENAVKSVKAGNLPTAKARLEKAREQIEKQGTMINLSIDGRYHRLRIQELELAARHLQALQAEKEAERAHREELREQKKVEAELARAKEGLVKERAMHQATLDALVANGDLEGAERMREKIADDERALENVEHRAANMRAGHVYVISNVGAFGQNMVKIGMTRRLEPMERVNELGDASVPFRFDVHALFYSDDAIETEAMLHRAFAEHRVNKVNLRREFFRVTPSQVLNVLREHHVELVEFSENPAAEEFRLSNSL